jgi:hypothetical protein
MAQMKLVEYAGAGSPPIETVSLKQFTALPFAVLFCTSRSGVTLLHTLLDGHPEVLQIPTYCKLYDFFAEYPGILEAPEKAIQAFVAYPNHDHMFDTDLSVFMHRGRIGVDGSARVVVSKAAFSTAAISLLGSGPISPRDFAVAVVVAYCWCLGQDLDRAKVVVIQIHHGDWLFSKQLVESWNLSPASPERDGIEVLRPDKALASVRNPVETLESLEQFVSKTAVPAECESNLERCIRLYIQDVLRHELCRSAGIPLQVSRLEDLRCQTRQEMNRIAEWLGVEPDHPQLLTPTAYGLPWYGDPFSTPSATPKPQPPIKPLSPTDPDHALVLLTVGRILAPLGYVDRRLLSPPVAAVAAASLALPPRRRRLWKRESGLAASLWRCRFWMGVRRARKQARVD